MTTCKDCIDFLMAYLDGELPPEQKARFDQHMKACPPCRDYLDSYRQTLKLTTDAKDCGCWSKPAVLPDKLVNAILDSLKAGAPRESGKTPS
jgi:anti-sigma factor RsiW